jgi:hypothetical protein
MPAGVRVPGGVAVGRAVAAQGDAAFLTGPQMDPLRVDLDALLAHPVRSVFDGFDGAEMGADFFRHDFDRLLFVELIH